MVKASIVGPSGGEVVPLGPTTMRILEDGGTTGHRLGIGEITVAPHSDGPPQHRHARHDEGFYVVSGTARFTVGTQTYDAPAGTLAMIPPGAPHTFANPAGEPLAPSRSRSPNTGRAALSCCCTAAPALTRWPDSPTCWPPGTRCGC
jgi:mannose-6-phosphate isomerase-like protein (cupin superfamily)